MLMEYKSAIVRKSLSAWSIKDLKVPVASLVCLHCTQGGAALVHLCCTAHKNFYLKIMYFRRKKILFLGFHIYI